MSKKRAIRKAREKTNGRCWYCGMELIEFSTGPDGSIVPGSAVLDHQVPRSKGGKGGNNLVPSCFRCNASKSGRSVDEYRWAVAYRSRALPPGMPRFNKDQIDWIVNNTDNHGIGDLKLPVFYGETIDSE